MSGTVPSGFAIILKLMVVLLVVLGLEYAGVILKLVSDSSWSVTWRIVFGLITPVVFLTGLLISNQSDNKTINFVLTVGLAMMNLIYLLIPMNSHFSTLIYGGENKIASMVLLGFVSIVTALFILGSLIIIAFFVFKSIK